MTDTITINKQVKINNIAIKITKKLYQKDYFKIFEAEDSSKSNILYHLHFYSIPVDSSYERTKCLQELYLYREINHKNIIKLKAYQETTVNKITYFYFLLDSLNCIPLQNLANFTNLENFHNFPEVKIWQIMYDVVQALNYLHYHKYIHRNVTLDSIFLCNDGCYKLGALRNAVNYQNLKNTPSNYLFSRNEKINIDTKIEETVFTLSNQVSIEYRCPEYINPLSISYMTEKVDIFSLGVVIFYLMFNHNPFNYLKSFNNSVREIVMRKNNNYFSLPLLEILIKMLTLDPEQRYSAAQILDFIESKITKGDLKYFTKVNIHDEINKIRVFNNSNYSLIDEAYKKLINLAMNCKFDQENSTRFYIVKMTEINTGIDTRIKIIKALSRKLWLLNDSNDERSHYFSKIFNHITFLPILYDSTLCQIALSSLDHILFLMPNIFKGNNEICYYLDFLSSVWIKRVTQGEQYAGFLSKYSELIKNKIKYFSKYTFIEANYTITSSNIEELAKNSNITILIHKGFITDTLSLYSSLCQQFNILVQSVQMKQDNCTTTDIIDFSYQILNEQIVTISKLNFIIIFAFKNYLSNEKYKSCVFDSRYFEITKKIREITDIQIKNRKSRNCKFLFFEIQLSFISTLESITERLKHFPNDNFNLKQFFEDPKNLCSYGLHSSVKKLIENNNFDNYNFKSIEKEAIVTDFKKSTSMKNEIVDSLKFLSNQGTILNNNTTSFYNTNKPIKVNTQKTDYSNNNKSSPFAFQTKKLDNFKLKDIYSEVSKNLNDYFSESNLTSQSSKNENSKSFCFSSGKSIEKTTPIKSNQPELEFEKIAKEINPQFLNMNLKNNINSRNRSNTTNQPQEMFPNTINNNIINSKNSRNNTSTIIDNNHFNKSLMNMIYSNNQNQQQSQSRNSFNTSNINMFKTISNIPSNTMNSNLSNNGNINIYNISNDYNNINYIKKINSSIQQDLGGMATSFVQKEASKRANYIINSKDIEIGKQIGFGGTSEVFKGIYRDSEVAVKKLRIMDLKDDKIKEFKREVQSLSMMRHPYLVLFMGAIAENDNISIVTEFCAGGTLFNLLHNKNLVFQWELRVRILYDIAVGINFLHTNNPPVIHRDLKSLK